MSTAGISIVQSQQEKPGHIFSSLTPSTSLPQTRRSAAGPSHLAGAKSSHMHRRLAISAEQCRSDNRTRERERSRGTTRVGGRWKVGPWSTWNAAPQPIREVIEDHKNAEYNWMELARPLKIRQSFSQQNHSCKVCVLILVVKPEIVVAVLLRSV